MTTVDTFAIIYPFLRSVAITFGVFGVLGLFAFFGNSGPLSYTPIGWLHRALEWLIFKIGGFLYTTLCQNRCMRCVTHYVFESPNPILQLVYVALVGGGYLMFLRDIYPHLGPHFLPTHVWLSHVLVAYTFGTFALACYSDPGVVSPATVAQHADSFPFDNLLYKAKKCETCNVDRPARSKHCRICNRCIARFDHHCPWINGCVGERNVRYFLLFLFSTAFICFYEAWLSYELAIKSYDEIASSYATRVRQHNRSTGDHYSTALPAQYALGTLMREHGLAVPLGLFCAMMGLVVFAFGSYHVYLVMRNTTTNETFKWSDVADWLRHVSRRRKKREQVLARRARATLGDADAQSAKDEDSDREVDTIAIPTAEQMNNIYNRGVMQNFSEVLWPPSLRRRAAAVATKKKQ